MLCTPAARDLMELSLTPGVGPVLGRRLVQRFGSARAALGAGRGALERVQGVGPERARKIIGGRARASEAARAELDACERAGARVVAMCDPAYPRLLAETEAAPMLLYVRGALPEQSRWFTVAIVGSRRATIYGIEQCERFSQAFAQAGLVVVSGGARGIDTAAHRAALRVRGATIAVIGSGLSRPYPPENAELYDRIVDEGGAVVSELPMGTPPSAENFPARNRIISGLSLGVVVVEAPARSGALITARYAGQEHGREVMALPGRVDSVSSRGTNELIAQGMASLVTSPSDVVHQLERQAWHVHRGTHDAMFARGQGEPDGAREEPPLRRPPRDLSEPQRRLVDALEAPMSVDALCRATGLEASVVASEATLLEIRGVVAREGGCLRRLVTSGTEDPEINRSTDCRLVDDRVP